MQMTMSTHVLLKKKIMFEQIQITCIRWLVSCPGHTNLIKRINRMKPIFVQGDDIIDFSIKRNIQLIILIL